MKETQLILFILQLTMEIELFLEETRLLVKLQIKQQNFVKMKMFVFKHFFPKLMKIKNMF